MLDFSHLPDKNNIDVQSFFSGAANNTIPYVNTFPPSLWNVSFDGNGDYLTVPDNAALELSANNFTIECWIYPTSFAAEQIIVNKVANSTVVGSYDIRLNQTTGTIQFRISQNSGGNWNINFLATSFGVLLNRWSHIALVRRTGNVFTLYINGVSGGSATSSLTLVNEATTTNIGANGDGSSPFFGYISNLRIVNGTALYTSTFTPPDKLPLAPIANTVLLTCRDATVIDTSLANSGVSFVITKFGNAAASLGTALNNTLSYGPSSGGNNYWIGNNFTANTATVNSYMTVFNGSNDYLTVPDAAPLQFGTGDFTVECWIYPTLTDGGQRGILAKGTNTTGWELRINGVTTSSLDMSYTSTPVTGVGTVVGNTWHHVAMTRSGTSLKVFLNGSVASTTTVADNFNQTQEFTIGNSRAGSQTFSGYISNVRVLKGQALYTSAFTPANTNLTAIANTVLLTCQDAKLIDNSSNNYTLKSFGTPVNQPVQMTWPTSANTIPNWQTWIKPRGVNWVYIIGVGGGASGVGGTYNLGNSSASAQPGGAGGGSGAQTVMMLPAALLPPVLYIHLGEGGRRFWVASNSPSVPGGNTYIAIEPLTSTIANNSQLILLTANGAPGTTGGSVATIGNHPLAGRAIKVTSLAGQSGTAGGATGASNGTSLILPTTGLMVTGGTGGGGKSINFTSPTSQGGNIAGTPPLSSTANTNMQVGYIPTANGGTSSIGAIANGGPGQAGYKFSNWLHLGGTGGGGGGTANTGLGSEGGAGGDGAPGCGGGGSGSGGAMTGLPGSGGDGFVHIISF